jgi:hypothetical protein
MATMRHDQATSVVASKGVTPSQGDPTHGLCDQLQDAETGAEVEDVTEPQQQLVFEQDRGHTGGGMMRESTRRAGLIGISQARAALADAVRRAQARTETKAA